MNIFSRKKSKPNNRKVSEKRERDSFSLEGLLSNFYKHDSTRSKSNSLSSAFNFSTRNILSPEAEKEVQKMEQLCEEQYRKHHESPDFVQGSQVKQYDNEKDQAKEEPNVENQVKKYESEKELQRPDVTSKDETSSLHAEGRLIHFTQQTLRHDDKSKAADAENFESDFEKELQMMHEEIEREYEKEITRLGKCGRIPCVPTYFPDEVSIDKKKEKNHTKKSVVSKTSQDEKQSRYKR